MHKSERGGVGDSRVGGRWRALCALSLLLMAGPLGCGPSVSTLVREGRYPEMMCRASSRGDLELAAETLVSKLAPYYATAEVGAADVAGAGLEGFLATHTVFGVRAAIRPPPFQLSYSEMTLLVKRANGEVVLRGEWLKDLAEAVGEELPQGHKMRSVDIDTKEATTAVLTLGLSRIFSSKKMVSVNERNLAPAPEAIRVHSPKTYALLAAVAQRDPEGELEWYVVPRAALRIAYRLHASVDTGDFNICSMVIDHEGDPLMIGKGEIAYSWSNWSSIMGSGFQEVRRK